MYRYVWVDLDAVGPTRVIGLSEFSDYNEDYITPYYIDVSDRLDISSNSWYDAAVGDFVPEPVYVPSVADAAYNKRYELYGGCSEGIIRSSFQSDALGAVHNYDCRIVDQINLQLRYNVAASTASNEPIWASDGTRYQWVEHTATEMADVMVEMNEHIKSFQVKLAAKLGAVDAATTVAEVNSITW